MSMYATVSFVFLFIDVTCCSWTTPTAYTKVGNITLGGLFPLHYGANRTDDYSLLRKPEPMKCHSYNYLGFRWMQAMFFAIEEINNSSKILPGVTLGWQTFDTCNTNAFAVSQSIYMVEENKNSNTANVIGVLGPTASDKSIVTSNVLSIFDIPQISYGSTSRLLSNRNIYNSFFRTIPNDDEQANAIVELLISNNWTWVGAIAGDDDYGRPGVSKLKDKAKERGICIEYTGYVSAEMQADDLEQIAKEVREFNATVFVVFMSTTPLQVFVKHLMAQNVTGKQWIASEAWATSDTIRKKSGNFFEGTLGVATRGGAMPGFRTFLERVSPKSQPLNPFLRQFWENVFHCSCTDCAGNSNNDNADIRECTGNESLASPEVRNTTYLTWDGNELEKSYNVYLAVYVVAQALDNITNCVEGSGLLENGSCPSLSSLEPWQLLPYIKKVDFFPPGQDIPFYFDENGDPNASYKLVSWVPSYHRRNVSIEFVHVGNYTTMKDPNWSIDYTNVHWTNQGSTRPISMCTPPCQPGFYKVRLSSDCCFACKQCPLGEYSTKVDSNVCSVCDDRNQSNENRTGCIPREEEYVKWNDAFGITFTVLVFIGVATTLFTAGVYFVKRDTPLVKATNIQVSFLLFFSITCCFLTPLFYISKPDNWSCQVRMVAFGISFTLSVAAILVKTLRVLTAFESRIPVRFKKRSRWLGENLQILVVFFVTLVQVLICVIWLFVNPPYVEYIPDMVSVEYLSVECNFGGVGFLVAVYSYLSLLALIAFIFAFRARKLPENFNEAKFITFSMLVFFIVWISFIPAYVTTSGYMSTVVYCIAILASTFGFVFCIFFPKLYIIFITPKRNTIEEVRMSTASHAVRATQRNLTTHIIPRTPTSLTSTPRLTRNSFDIKLVHGFSQSMNVNNSNNTNSTDVGSPENDKANSRRETLRKKYFEKYSSMKETHTPPVTDCVSTLSSKDSSFQIDNKNSDLSTENDRNLLRAVSDEKEPKQRLVLESTSSDTSSMTSVGGLTVTRNVSTTKDVRGNDEIYFKDSSSV